jgi:hypothetical protein
MYDIAGLITHIQSETGYSTDWAKEKELDLGLFSDPVFVKVGYHSLEANGVLDDGSAPDPYVQFSEDLTQHIIVQFICKQSDLPTVWKAVYDACAKWLPLPVEENYTALTHSGGGTIGIKGGRIWWLDRWRIDFPRANEL